MSRQPADVVRAPAAPESVWRRPGFGWLFAGSIVSWFGTEISELALPLLLIVTIQASETEVGLVRAAQFLPFLLLTLHAGVLVDRVRRRPLMIGADLGRFLVLGAIPVLIWLGVDRVEPVYLLVFVAGALTVGHQLAVVGYLPTLIGRERLLDANGKLGAAQSAAEMGGQGIGGLLVAALTAPVAIVVDALSYLFSAFAVGAIRHVEAPPSPGDEPRSRLRAEIGEGLRLVVRNRYLRALVAEGGTFNLAYQVFMIALLLWLARDLRMSPVLIGLIVSAGAIGAFVGAAVGARVSGRYGYGRTMLVTLTIGNGAPLALVVVTGAGPLATAVLVAVFLVMGFGVALANVHNVTLRQTIVPNHLQGRVNAAYRLISWGAIPVGAALGGSLAAHLGSRAGVLVGAAGIALATLWVALSPIPRLRTTPTADSSP